MSDKVYMESDCLLSKQSHTSIMRNKKRKAKSFTLHSRTPIKKQRSISKDKKKTYKLSTHNNQSSKKMSKWLYEEYAVVLLPVFETSFMVRRGQCKIWSLGPIIVLDSVCCISPLYMKHLTLSFVMRHLRAKHVVIFTKHWVTTRLLNVPNVLVSSIVM